MLVEAMTEQLVLPMLPPCKERGCDDPIVGHSVRGDGHVCKRHNEREWALALSRSAFEDWRAFGRAWLARTGSGSDG